jgi:hypothetical protein
VLDARRPADVRTLVSGVAGEGLRRVTIVAGGRRRTAPIGPGGTFVVALPGYPENLGLDVRLLFADGRTERHPLGVSRFVTPDPLGDRSWKVQGFVVDSFDGNCVLVQSARSNRSPSAAPAVCGRLGRPERPRGYFFAVRRITRGDAKVWNAPPRTLVWGGSGDDVRRFEVQAGGDVVESTAGPSGAFVAVLPGDIPARSVRVRVFMRDGTVHRHAGDTNLIPTPRGSR